MGEFEGLAQVGTAVIGSKLGGMLAGNDKVVDPNEAASQFVNGRTFNMNDLLQTALGNAINESTNYTNKAIDQQNQSLGTATGAINQSLGTATGAINTGLGNATNALQSYLTQGISGAKDAANQGFNLSQALNSPYSNAGMGAIDAYQDSLGLKRPQIGSQAISQGLQQLNQLAPQIQQLQSQGKAAGATNAFGQPIAPKYQQPNFQSLPTPGPAPTLNNTPFGKTVADYIPQERQILDAWYSQNIDNQGRYPWMHDTYFNNMLMPESQKLFDQDSQSYASQQQQSNAALMQQYNSANQAAQAAVQKANYDAQQQAMSQYQSQMGLFNPYQKTYSSIQQQLNGMNPQVLQAGLAASQGLFQ